MLSCKKIIELTSISGSPFYLCDEKVFVHNIERFRRAFSRWPGFILAYSYKTNYVPYLCGIVRDKGCWAEVVSRMEYDLAVRIGQNPEKIIFNGPVKHYGDIEQALDSNSIVNLDALYELQHLGRYAMAHPGRPLRIGLRINIALADSCGRSKIQNHLPVGRFGFSPVEEKFSPLLEALKQIPNLSVVSLHGHTSSADRSVDCYRIITKTLADIAQNYFPQTVEYINIGGGFFGSVPPEMSFENTPSFDDYAQAACQVLESYNWTKTPSLVIEPGIALAADAFSFITRVISLKQIAGKTIITVDGSAFNVKPTFHSRNLPFAVIAQDEAPRTQGRYSVAGATCMEKDYLLTDVSGTVPLIGDYLCFSHCGAYTLVMTPPFINPAPAVVVPKGDGFRVIRSAQRLDDVFANYSFAPAAKSAVLITGDNVRLRPLEEKDLPTRIKWYNDPQVHRTLVVAETFELEKTIAWFACLSRNPSRIEFVVETLDSKPIGITGLLDIDRRNRTAECYCVIGEKEFWGKGLGTEIHSLLIRWAFQEAGIEKIRADIRTNNPAILKVVEKLGFEIEGTLRKEKVVDGQRIDLYRVGLLRKEFIPAHKIFKAE